MCSRGFTHVACDYSSIVASVEGKDGKDVLKAYSFTSWASPLHKKSLLAVCTAHWKEECLLYCMLALWFSLVGLCLQKENVTCCTDKKHYVVGKALIHCVIQHACLENVVSNLQLCFCSWGLSVLIVSKLKAQRDPNKLWSSVLHVTYTLYRGKVILRQVNYVSVTVNYIT